MYSVITFLNYIFDNSIYYKKKLNKNLKTNQEKKNATTKQRAICGYGAWVTIVDCREYFPCSLYAS